MTNQIDDNLEPFHVLIVVVALACLAVLGTAFHGAFIAEGASCSPAKVSSLPYASANASWAADDCVSQRRADSKADYYAFSIDGLQQVDISLTSKESGALYLVNGDGQLVDSAKHDGFQRSVVSIRPNLGPGTYTLEVATVHPNRTGDYSLTITAVAPRASIVPDPAKIKFKPNGKWHTFSVDANVPVEVLVNPAGAKERLEIATKLPPRTFCPPEANDDAQRSDGQRFYLAACAPGTGVIEVRAAQGGGLLAKYSIPIKGLHSGTYAVLSPNPSKTGFKPNGKWSAFKVASDVDVEIKANPTGETPILELTTSTNSGNHCSDGAEIGDNADAGDGDTIYLMPCQAGTGTVSIYRRFDSKLLATYTIKVKETPPKASMSVNPSTATFVADGTWQSFTIDSNVDVEIVVNPPGSQQVMEITTRDTPANYCHNGAEPSDDVDASNGDTIYLAACDAGTGTVNIYRQSDKKLLATYTIKVEYAECKTVTDFYALRQTPQTVWAFWKNPTGGAPVVKRILWIHVWDDSLSTWRQKTHITEPPHNTELWHGHAFENKHWAYRMITYCKDDRESLPTRWWIVGSPPSDVVQGASGEELPTPTPTPKNAPTRSGGDIEEHPPSPR